MKYLHKLAGLLTHSIFIGVLLSLIFAFFTLKTLTSIIDWSPSLGEKSKTLLAAETMHLKSVDYRLWVRGQRKGADNVALLTIDDDSISRVGRWPWPREKMAKAVDEIMKYGAKVISFDITFSEPSLHPTKKLFETHNLEKVLPEQISTIIKDKIKNLDSDTILASMLQRHSEKVVIGGFNEDNELLLQSSPVEKVCFEIYFPITSTATYWETQHLPLITLDSAHKSQGVLNEEIIDKYRSRFQELYTEKLKEIASTEQLTITDFFSHKKVERLIDEYFVNEICPNWLDPNNDPMYSEMQSYWTEEVVGHYEEGQIEPTFDEWVSNFKSSPLGYELPDKSAWVLTTRSAIYGSDWYSKMDFELNTMSPLTIAEEAEEDPPYFHFGFFNAELDDDGTIRRKALVTRSGGRFYPSIALKAYLVAYDYNAQVNLGLVPHVYGHRRVIKSIDIIDNNSGEKVFSIPVNRNGELLINYAGERSMFPYANAADIIDESKPTVRITEKVFRDGRWIDEIKDYPKSEWIKDKIFIFGVTAIAVFDLRVTPFDENFPGAETHVNVVDNLIRKDFLQPLEKADLFTSGFVLLISIFLTLALSYSGAVVGFVISGLTIFGIALGDKLFFFDKGVVTPIIFPIIASLSIYVILTFYKYFTEERKKKELKGTFSKYVSPSIVDEVLKDPENLQLGGRKQMMSVFFSDVRGFTTISEQLDPQALSDLLNSYLTPMTDLVFQNKGTLDKYMGDAVMAFFGAPISYPDHAAAACRCAIQSLVKLKELQKEYEAKGLPMIDIGIGINTGEMSVGNMGSETVRNYTVMGDAVNLGSRLEGINKQYGTRIIISEYTHEHVKDQFLCREIDWVRVKGKVEPVKIFELIAEGSAPSAIEEVVSHFNEGFALYHQRQFKEAVEEFNKNLQIDPEDGPTQLYIDRCQNYIENPPESDWDGVFTMTTK